MPKSGNSSSNIFENWNLKFCNWEFKYENSLNSGFEVLTFEFTLEISDPMKFLNKKSVLLITNPKFCIETRGSNSKLEILNPST